MRRSIGSVSMVVAFVLAVGGRVLAAEGEDAKANAKVQEAAMMEKAKQLGAPSQGHQMLEPFAGKWRHTVRWQMAPDAKPEESTGTNENSWIMGGRFLKQEAKGQAMGEPFEGLGILGYDNIRQEYSSIWIDNMNTSMMTATGRYDALTKTLHEQGSFSCPITGETHRSFRTVWKIIDRDHYVYEGYSLGPDGKEFKSLEVSYTRE